MKDVKVLDCTLRDGGYVNNWNFGKDTIVSVAQKLTQSRVEIVECGFLSEKKVVTENQSQYNTLAEAEKYLDKNAGCTFACMINFGEYEASHLPVYDGGLIKTLRVAFHKKDMENAASLCRDIKSRGYDVFLQPMATQYYSEEELTYLIDRANEFCPKAFYIVDSFGTMKKSQMLNLYNILEKKLKTDIAIGFHSHNNMQLSFSHAQELMNVDKGTHQLIVDSSVYGMGRGAGNLCTELITKYINDNYREKYDIIPILEILDEHLMQIFIKSPWGYSVPYYVASINNCHPNYASFLLERQSLSVKDIHKILSNMEQSKRTMFDKDYIMRLYEEYQSKLIDDSSVISKLTDEFSSRNLLVVAPGKSINIQSDKIKRYIDEHNALVLSVNFVPGFDCDYVFVGNQRRYKRLVPLVEDSKIIVTSNISVGNESKALCVNYSDLLCDDDIIADNSGMMVLNLLKRTGAKSVALAGYDGFSVNRMDNYYQEKLISGSSVGELSRLSEAIKNRIKSLKASYDIRFVTTSMYEKQGE